MSFLRMILGKYPTCRACFQSHRDGLMNAYITSSPCRAISSPSWLGQLPQLSPNCLVWLPRAFPTTWLLILGAAPLPPARSGASTRVLWLSTIVHPYHTSRWSSRPYCRHNLESQWKRCRIIADIPMWPQLPCWILVLRRSYSGEGSWSHHGVNQRNLDSSEGLLTYARLITAREILRRGTDP